MIFYFIAFFIYFLWKFFRSNDKFLWSLYGAAYFVGTDVYLRMTRSALLWELGKYGVILFSILGMFYVGFKRNSVPYFLYFLFLLPAVWIGYLELSFDVNFRKAVMFNLSGPFCLSAVSIFTYGRTIKIGDFLKILDFIIYPLIATTVYIIAYQPSGVELFVNTASNSSVSGGYGANQVSTVLGLGFFLLFIRFILPYRNRLVYMIMMFFMALMGYRALLTFSRGGVVTAIICMALFLSVYFLNASALGKTKTIVKLFLIIFGSVMLWGVAEATTDGMITNRYTNKDAIGREKEDITTGRAQLAEAEFEQFSRNPVFGGGVGGSKEFFEEELGKSIATHNEITRMFSEHGLFGILALMTLIIAPCVSILQGRRNVFFIPLMLFWFLTIAHSSMRLAAPAFIYALCLLNLDYAPEKKPVVRRKSVAEPRALPN